MKLYILKNLFWTHYIFLSINKVEESKKIAENSGSKLGDLITAKMGIFQITGQNSNEDYSWGGAYNTSSKEKTASITMKLTYLIK